MHTLPARSCKFIAQFLYLFLLKQINHGKKKNKEVHVKPLDNLLLYKGIFCVLSLTIWHFMHMYLSLWFWLHILHTMCKQGFCESIELSWRYIKKNNCTVILHYSSQISYLHFFVLMCGSINTGFSIRSLCSVWIVNLVMRFNIKPPVSSPNS